VTSRERIQKALDHQEPDMVPLDLGSTTVTGIHVSSLYKLKIALGLAKEGEPVKVSDPFQMLGEVDEPVRKALGIDTISLESPKNFFGFENAGWKPWRFFDGTPLLVPEKFNTAPDSEGNIYQYPKGNLSCAPSGKMPRDGFYHDTICRQKPFREEDLRVEDQVEEYSILSEEELRHYERESQKLFEETDYAIVFNGVPGTSIGDIAWIPGPYLENPKGIRDAEEWYISLLTRQDFVKQVFARMTDIGLENLRLLHQAVGERIQVLMVSGADFGSQLGPIISKELYRKLFKPFHTRINEWIRTHTRWRTFIHTCGSVYELLPDLQEAGFDILNPIQISAASMNPETLKREFGSRFTFWGGGINTQQTLPFKSPEEVKEEVRSLVKTWKTGGGFVFAAVHNIQAGVPTANLLALWEAFQESRQYL